MYSHGTPLIMARMSCNGNSYNGNPVVHNVEHEHQ